MEMEIIILAAEDFTISNEGKKDTTGVSVQYIATDNLTPCAEENFRGYRVIKEWLPMELNAKIKQCPAVYSAKISMKVNTKMIPTLKLVDVDYLCEIGTTSINKK